MIWLSLMATLAMAQDGPDPLGLYDGAAPPAAATADTGQAPPTAAVAPVAIQTARPAPVATAPVPVGSGWLWSYGGPLVLLGGALAGAWMIRKRGLKIPGFGGQALAAFQAEGPSVEVKARTPLAGQNTLAVVEVTGFGPTRSLLVTAGPGGSRLVADLSGQPSQPPAQGADAVADAIRQALSPAAAAASTPVQAPVPVLAAPIIAAPQASQAAVQSTPQAPTAVPTAAVPVPAERAPAIPTPAVPDAQGDQPDPGAPADLAFQSELAGAMDSVQRREPATEPPPSAPARPANRTDWRAATYLQSAPEPPPAEEDRVDVIGELAHKHRRRAFAPEPNPRRADAQAVSHGRARRSHLEQLTRSAPQPAARRFGGPVSRRSTVVRDAGSRAERTQAARELLEQVMARRRAERL